MCLLLSFSLLMTAVTPQPPSARPVTTLESTSAPAALDGITKDQLPLATLPDDRLTVEVRMRGEGPFRFLVDTGADRSAISRQLAERLGLTRGKEVQMHSVTGLSSVATASVRGMSVASRELPDINAPLLEATHIRADGILGTDVLRSALVRFDFRSNLLSISSQQRSVRGSAPGEIVVEARRRAGRLIVTEAEADGQRVTVVLDTGSEVTIGNQALRRALGRRGFLREDRQIELASVTGEKLTAMYAFLQKLDIGDLALTDLGVAFADAHIFKVMGLEDRPALLLGMNAMRAFDSVTIDFRARKLRFALPDGAGPQSSRRTSGNVRPGKDGRTFPSGR